MRQFLTWFCLSSALVVQAGAPAEPYAYTGRLGLDITKVPFSRYGSTVAFSKFTEENLVSFHATGLPTGVYLRSVDGDQRTHPVFRVELLDADKPVPFVVEAGPSLLRLKAAQGIIEVCIADSNRVKFRGHGVSLRLVAQDGALAVPNFANHWEVNSERVMEKYMLWATSGELHMDAPWNGLSNPRVAATFSPDPESLRVEGEIDTYPSVWTPHQDSETFDESVTSIAKRPKLEPSSELSKITGVANIYARLDLGQARPGWVVLPIDPPRTSRSSHCDDVDRAAMYRHLQEGVSGRRMKVDG